MRGSISAGLDDELSEFESVRLRAHLETCESCREFEASAQISTLALRAAPLEPVTSPVVVPSRSRRPVILRVPAAAAAAVMMIAFGGLFESLHGGVAINRPRPSQAAANDLLDTRAIAKRQQQANFQQLLIRRAQFESNQIPRHAGFQP
jgi:predicted anti-sigma-YlaC factor YlaD